LSKRKTSALRAQQQDTRYNNEKKSTQTFYMKESKTINFEQVRGKPLRKTINLVPRTLNQESFIVALLDENTDIVVVSGPAGTGKT
jgi:predicted ribonuclease YlaK